MIQAGWQEQPLLPAELQVDGGCLQRGGRRRCYAAVCRARSYSHLLLGHRLARRTGRRARWERCRSESGSDTEPSDWVQVGTVSRDAEVGFVSRRASVVQHEQHDTSDEEHAEGEQCPQPGRGWRRGQRWRRCRRWRRWGRRRGEPGDLDLDIND
eukprot:scaffold41333_cov45-Phaeocystis_antarctica.AAC.2